MGDNQNNEVKNENIDINKLEKAKREKFDALVEAGKNPFLITKYDVTNHSKEIKENFDEFENKHVSVAGRMMLKRVMGKD